MSLTAHTILAHITDEQTASLMEVFTRLQEPARRSSTRICDQANRNLLRESISVLAEKLEPFGFVRTHRSVLVNSSFVEEIKSYPSGEYGLRVRGGKEYTVTRTYKENLECLAEFWIGTGEFLTSESSKAGRW